MHLRRMPLWVRATRPLIRRLPAGRYRAMNALVQAAAYWRRTEAPFLADAGGDFRFVCHLADSIAREVCYLGRYEPIETLLTERVLRPGMMFIDVGANWGYFSLLAARRVGDSGRVLSLEPDPRLFALLQSNIAASKFRNVLPLPLAAAASSGTVALAGFHEAAGNWGLSRLAVAAGDNTFSVETVSIDALVRERGVKDIDLVKMDVEGAEDLVLEGMADGLTQHRYRRMLLELHPELLAERSRTVSQALHPLLDAHYRGWKIDHSRAATRAACYGTPDPRHTLTPLKWDGALDAWPHTFWLAPGLELHDVF